MNAVSQDAAEAKLTKVKEFLRALEGHFTQLEKDLSECRKILRGESVE